MSTARKRVLVPGKVREAEKRHRAPRVAYTPELGAKVAEQIANAATLREIAAKPGMPSKRAILLWMQQHPEFRQMMMEAREVSAFVYADKALERAMELLEGDVTPADVKAAAEALKHIRWDASKRAPRAFGDQHKVGNTVAVQINTTMDLGNPDATGGLDREHTFTFQSRIPPTIDGGEATEWRP